MMASACSLPTPGTATNGTHTVANPWPGLGLLGLLGLLNNWAQRLTELRIDVDLSGRDIQREFDALHDRIRTNHRTRDAMQPLPLHLLGLVLRMREADGEVFVYAIDPQRNRIVAYTVFNRLVEVDRRTDRHLRAPHTKVAHGYRRMGIASAIYRWWLDSGRSLMTGARQSAGAHGLWMALARDYELAAVRIAEHKRVEQLPMPPPPGFYAALDTRLVLVGRGCRLADFAQHTAAGS